MHSRDPAAMLSCYSRSGYRMVPERVSVGAWLSLARAPGSGPGGRWFKSTRPDHYFPLFHEGSCFLACASDFAIPHYWLFDRRVDPAMGIFHLEYAI
jgi:hypothetical protein